MYINKERDDLTQIFLSALDRVDPYKIIIRHVNIKDNILFIKFENEEKHFDLSNYEDIYVFGAGKATAKMTKAVEEIFGDRLKGGIVALKEGHTEKLNIIEKIYSGHPIPDENSIIAAKKMIETSKKFTKKTLVINLISGGGSALLECPVEYEDSEEKIFLTLNDLRQTTKTLLECGANINEFNCIRKHISAIKGGRFAGILYPATSINLILSDVVGDSLDTIASGLTTFDNTTFKDAFDIITKYDIENKLPGQVVKIIEYGMKKTLDDTPKSSNKIFLKVNNILIGTNYSSLLEASKKAGKLGYNSFIVTSQLIGEAKEAAKFLIGIAKDVNKYEHFLKRPACIITGGETTVTIHGKGKGGRNQEMALSYLSEISKDPEFCTNIHFLSASTDGNDGPTDAAGAFASCELLKDSIIRRLSIRDYLKNNDSYHFFEKINGLLKTSPTNTNVGDIQIQIIK